MQTVPILFMLQAFISIALANFYNGCKKQHNMKDSLSEMNNNNTQYIETLLRSRVMHRRFNLHT